MNCPSALCASNAPHDVGPKIETRVRYRRGEIGRTADGTAGGCREADGYMNVLDKTCRAYGGALRIIEVVRVL